MINMVVSIELGSDEFKMRNSFVKIVLLCYIVVSSGHLTSMFYRLQASDNKPSESIYFDRLLKPPRSANLHAPKTNFIGRVNELQQVKYFHTQNKPVVITGQSGVGKTEFALQYASIYNKLFNADVYWIECKSVGEMLSAIYNLADNFGVLIQSNTTDTLLEDMFRFLEHSHTLFIFDDADVQNTFILNLSSMLNKYRKLSILITSVHLKWNMSIFSILKLDSFTKQEAIQFIKAKFEHYEFKLNEESYNSFPEELEYVPMILENVTDLIICDTDFKLQPNTSVEGRILSILRSSTYKREDSEKEKIIIKKLAMEDIQSCVKTGIINATSPEWAEIQYQRLTLYHRKKTGSDWP